jgi:hypothetical protein
VSGLKVEVCFAISRLQATFVDDIGDEKSGIATGVWILSKGKKLFVTNRHSLDLSMKYQKNTYKLTKTEIELRIKVGGRFQLETRFFEVKNPSFLFGLNTDLAVIVEPEFDPFPGVFGHLCLELSVWETDEDFFRQNCRLAADIFFIGFPMNFFDEKWKLPIARHAIIASVSQIGFSHKEIKTEDALLASGLSFEGGSGSPVFSSARGLRINADKGFADTDDYCPQKLIGIMTGHLQFPPSKESFGRKEELFTRHSGLSYFIKTTALRRLLNENGI